MSRSGTNENNSPEDWALGLPLLLLSAWAMIPAFFFAALMVVRTKLEDAALTNELDGYREYQRTTRYRLLPGVW